MSLFHIGGRAPPSFDDPIGMLETCHRRIEQQLDALGRATNVVDSDPAALAVLEEACAYFDSGGVRHTQDEEASLFPRLLGDATASLLRQLEDEHRTHEAIYMGLRTVVRRLRETPALAGRLRGELGDHAAAMAAAYRDHIRVEETELFPLARALDARELRAIGLEMRLRRG